MRAPILLAVAVAIAACDAKPEPGAASASAASLAPAAAWSTFRDPGGVFEARFPAEPTVREDGDAKDSRLRSISVEHASEDWLFSAARIELASVERYDCKGGLAGMVKSSLDAMGCSADEDHERAFGPLPGREVGFRCQKRPMRGVMRVGCDDRELAAGRIHAYSTLATAHETAWNGDIARDFLDSFTFTGAAATPAAPP